MILSQPKSRDCLLELFINQSVYLSINQYAYRFIFLPIYLSVFLSIFLSFCTHCWKCTIRFQVKTLELFLWIMFICRLLSYILNLQKMSKSTFNQIFYFSLSVMKLILAKNQTPKSAWLSNTARISFFAVILLILFQKVFFRQ